MNPGPPVVSAPQSTGQARSGLTAARLAAALAALGALLLLAGLAVGSEGFSLAWGDDAALIASIRAPRSLGALAAGALLGLANPAWWLRLGLVGAAFAGALGGVSLTLLMAGDAARPVKLLLCGVVVGVLLDGLYLLALLRRQETRT